MFDLTAVGGTSTLMFQLSNSGTASTAPLGFEVAGPSDGEYTIDYQLTTCTVLAPSESCTFAVVFSPIAVGERVATLAIANGASALHLVLTGPAGAADLSASQPAPLAAVEVGIGAVTTVVVSNDGLVEAPIDSIVVTGSGFSLGETTCGSSLPANSTCNVNVVVTPSGLGELDGSVVVMSAGIPQTAAVTAHAVHKITVVKAGTGTGTINMGPPTITCGSTCEVFVDKSLILTEVSDSGTTWGGWSLPETAGCGASVACFVPASNDPITVVATFVPTGSTKLKIQYTAGGTGTVLIQNNGTTTRCDGPCTTSIIPGPVTLTGSATATISGYTGDCTSGGSQCSFTAGPGISDVTVNVSGDPKAAWGWLTGPGTEVYSATFDSAGALIVATTTDLLKLSATGDLVWSRPIAANGLAGGLAETIHVLTSTSVLELDSTGSIVWSAPWDGGAACHQRMFSNCIAVAADGTIATNEGSKVGWWSPTGTASWTRPGALNGIGFDANNNVVAPWSFGVTLSALRYAPDGSSLSPLMDLSPYTMHASLATDAAGNVYTYSSANRHAYLGQSEVATFLGVDRPGGVAGGGAHMFDLAYWTDTAWWLTWTVPTFGGSITGTTQPIITNMAMSSSGRTAAVGHFNNVTYQGGWVQVYEP